MELSDLPPLREIIAQHSLSAQKALGQNFLLDSNLTRKIARQAGNLSQASVIEVGPGPGGLTRALLQSGLQSLIAIERDPRCVQALESLVKAAQGKLQIYEGDALETSFSKWGQGPWTIVANLPYNIATPLLIKWLREGGIISKMILMFQKEVAERIVASPSTKTYGRLSIVSQARAKCRKLFDIPASAFTPPPKIVSSVVEIIPYPISAIDYNFKALEVLTQAAFGQRRKMLRSSLKPVLANPEQTLRAIGIDPQRRAEDLRVVDFLALSQLIELSLLN